MAISKTCNISPSENALTMVVGIMCMKKSPDGIDAGMRDFLMHGGGIDLRHVDMQAAAGFKQLTSTQPMTSASVVMISKHRIALAPTRPTCFMSPMPAMPLTMVQKMIGAISILMRLIKPSPSGFMACPVSGAKCPTSTPATMPASTQKKRERMILFVFGIRAA